VYGGVLDANKRKGVKRTESLPHDATPTLFHLLFIYDAFGVQRQWDGEVQEDENNKE
jgi:hypothetical protein